MIVIASGLLNILGSLQGNKTKKSGYYFPFFEYGCESRYKVRLPVKCLLMQAVIAWIIV